MAIDFSASSHFCRSGVPKTSLVLLGAISQPFAWISLSSWPGAQPA